MRLRRAENRTACPGCLRTARDTSAAGLIQRLLPRKVALESRMGGIRRRLYELLTGYCGSDGVLHDRPLEGNIADTVSLPADALRGTVYR